MDHTDRPSTSPNTGAKCVCIVQLSVAALRALADGDLDAANRIASVRLTPYFVDSDWRGTWRRRSAQVEADPDSVSWVTGVIWDVERLAAVGRAGYHGPPDAAGMVEIGYAVDPAWRRQGYARAALEVLLERAQREPSVRTIRATVRPDNVGSLRLLSQYPFIAVGEQWDEEDGLETIYELDVSTPD